MRRIWSGFVHVALFSYAHVRCFEQKCAVACHIQVARLVMTWNVDLRRFGNEGDT